MKKDCATARKSGNFHSPGTPNHGTSSVGVSKGWSSERVPLPSNRRQIGAALLPLNNNPRGLPSKWEDAERWISSPVSGDGGGRVSSSSSSSQQPLKKPKSKSGPLGAPGIAYHSMYSPSATMYEGGNLSSHIAAGSPFSAGVVLSDGWSFRVSGGGRGFSSSFEPCIARSVSVHGCIDHVCQETSQFSSQGGVDEAKDASTTVSRAVSRRDMATQMSPEGSCHSSPTYSFSQSNPSNLTIVEVQSFNSLKPEARDVQIDERVNVTRWPKKHSGCNPSKRSENVDESKLKSMEPHSSAWEASETIKSLSKARRDEAKITAWENLQKAKAEAAIRKLEMKLEKKRSSSTDKIMKKLRFAQKKAQEMRNAILTNQVLQESKTNENPMSLRTRQMGLLSGCFTCHAVST